MKKGDALPNNHVLAGAFINRNWAYIEMNIGKIGAKSDRTVEEPN